MEYIIFDLEWNQPQKGNVSFFRRAKMSITGEIIQIGAVKIRHDGTVCDSFNVLVKPFLLGHMNKNIQILTGISDSMLMEGKPFTEAYESFFQWCGENPTLLSWGADDMQLLEENRKLHNISSSWEFDWYDGQRIYAYETKGNVEPISLGKALEERELQSELAPHDALHDSLHMATLLGTINLSEGIKHYKEMKGQTEHNVAFVNNLTFVVYENIMDKRKAFSRKDIRVSSCPICNDEMTLTRREKTTGDKYLSLGSCPSHGAFAILWKFYKYGHSGLKKYYMTKEIYKTNNEIEAYYYERANINRLKEEKRNLWKKLHLDSSS